jgi:two-component system, NtrC family, nitrogen regulation response regulator NtrX
LPETIALAGRSETASTTSRLARELVGRSVAITRVQELVRRTAAASGGVLLVAHRGGDVESVARDLHARGVRSGGAFQRVECGAADAARLDRLLFGVPAAATPADLESVASDSQIASAAAGVLFLQNVTDMPASVQARVARVARDGEVRIDGARTATEIRWIASAAPGIEGDVRSGRFRSDLYRRLAASRIDLPPLRDRPEDVNVLAARLLEDWCEACRCGPRTFTQSALALLSALAWPGNLAELQLVVERAAADAAHDAIRIEDVLPALQLESLDTRDGAGSPAPFVPAGNLRDARLGFEREYIAAVLQHHGWRMAEAAKALGIQRPNLYRKARQLGIPLARSSE